MNILLLNGGKQFGHSNGELSQTLHHVAKDQLTALNHQIQETFIDGGYDIAAEIDKFLWADVVIYQMPAWWMGEPWTVKKYIDEVFTLGHGKIYASDGRTRADASKKYGSGGLLQGRKFMLSVTWNAPEEAFTDPAQFFEGVGVDGVYLHFHKLNEFVGMIRLPTFMCNDVKSPDVPKYIADYQAHLRQLFS